MSLETSEKLSLELRAKVIKAKEQGLPDHVIGEKFGVSFHKLEEIITEAFGTNVSALKGPKSIKTWGPKDFEEEKNTVWSFRSRGNWATHDGRYRGNWSPYIPRNVILKYSKPGDVILDFFSGGGTTAVEAKLLGRRSIIRDINPGAVGITLENTNFSPPLGLFENDRFQIFQPDVKVGDARKLTGIKDNSVDLICAHPPYADIIKYSSNISGDLSGISLKPYLDEMAKVAAESFRVLKSGHKCVILIGDGRKNRYVVPMGFETINVFLNAGFELRDLVLKRQHNCKTTGFWYTKSIEYNFLLLAHEFLPIFEKPLVSQNGFLKPDKARKLLSTIKPILNKTDPSWELETTTVWIFPERQVRPEIRRNLMNRFSIKGKGYAEVILNGVGTSETPGKNIKLLNLTLPDEKMSEALFSQYREWLNEFAQNADVLAKDGHLVIEAKDFRSKGKFVPAGLLTYMEMKKYPKFRLKEIVIVTEEDEAEKTTSTDELDINHSYLLIFQLTHNPL